MCVGVMMVWCTLGGSLMDLSKAFGITDVAEMTDRVGDRQSRKEIRVLMLTMFISQYVHLI